MVAGIGRSVMATGGRNSLVEELPLQANRMFPRDFLERFSGSTDVADESAVSAASRKTEEVELSLGLSLGGSFGAEARDKNDGGGVGLFKSSSSIATAAAAAAIGRTCSLPVEVDEEHRKRKEMQSLKRLEAKRKRSEKRNSCRADVAPAEDSDGSRSKAARSAPKPDSAGAAARLAEGRPKSSSGSSEEKCPSRMPDDDRRSDHKVNFATAAVGPAKEMEMETEMRSVMEEMPFVSTKGDGPDGRRIQGFLYRYKRVEEVRIVCVCHGKFLTPAEFVKHAGGGDVVNPLKHIVVIPSLAVFSSP